jgi:hypothetical protein
VAKRLVVNLTAHFIYGHSSEREEILLPVQVHGLTVKRLAKLYLLTLLNRKP